MTDIDAKIERLTTSNEELVSLVNEAQERLAHDHRLLRLTSVLLAGMVIIGVIGLVALAAFLGLNQRIDHCLSPGHACSARNATTTQLVIASVSFSTDAQRLSTEIPVAQSNGQSTVVEIRQRQLDHDIAMLQEIAQDLLDVQQGHQPSVPVAQFLVTEP